MAPPSMRTPSIRSPGPGRAPSRSSRLDLHPENVMITADGPVVTDWTNAADGPPELDLAMTRSWLDVAERAQAATMPRPSRFARRRERSAAWTSS
jgi:aminoglycoside phosphotransferase (APT) family kinase protein